MDNYLVMTLAEKHPNWRVPQLAVLGLAGVGKSSLLERLLLISVFPRRHHHHHCQHDRKQCDSSPQEGQGQGEGGAAGKGGTEEESDCEEAGGGCTYVPLHIKLRHVHKKLAAAMPPVVMRVIDTNKKVAGRTFLAAYLCDILLLLVVAVAVAVAVVAAASDAADAAAAAAADDDDDDDENKDDNDDENKDDNDDENRDDNDDSSFCCLVTAGANRRRAHSSLLRHGSPGDRAGHAEAAAGRGL
jgi:hypothetical protein